MTSVWKLELTPVVRRWLWWGAIALLAVELGGIAWVAWTLASMSRRNSRYVMVHSLTSRLVGDIKGAASGDGRVDMARIAAILRQPSYRNAGYGPTVHEDGSQIVVVHPGVDEQLGTADDMWMTYSKVDHSVTRHAGAYRQE